MALTASELIRVLLWLPPGILRSILATALANQDDIVVLDSVHPGPESTNAERATLLRDVVQKTIPDVVIAPIDASEVRRLTAPIGETAAILISSDWKSALSCEWDLPSDAIAPMVRAVARRASLS